jgi:hypothetical protein
MAVVEPTKLLFIGNSYLYYNDLPRVMEALAISSGMPIITGIVAGGGFSLERHVELGNVQPAIEGREPTAKWTSSKRVVRVPAISGRWDWVIMQEQSLRPLEDPEKLVEAAASIAVATVAGGSKPVLLATWARKNAPESQPHLSRAVADAARQVGAALVPAGKPEIEVVSP